MPLKVQNRYFNKGFISHGVLNLAPSECYELSNNGAIIVDVREDYLNSFKMFEVANVMYMPFSGLKNTFRQMPENVPLILADSVGLKSREAVLFMSENGYQNAANMAGGIVDWERDGLPLTTDINYRLLGSCMCQLKAREGGSGRGRDGGKLSPI
jgi:rhodanese-related sulfurtransferase